MIAYGKKLFWCLVILTHCCRESVVAWVQWVGNDGEYRAIEDFLY